MITIAVRKAHVRLLRARARRIGDAAAKMKFREARSTLMILAQSYDRMADELDQPARIRTRRRPARREKLKHPGIGYSAAFAAPACASDGTAGRPGSSRGA